MAQIDNRYAQPGIAVGQAATFDAALRSYMLSVYNYMAGGVALTGVVAYAINQFAVTTVQSEAVARFGHKLLTPFGQFLYASPFKWVLIFAPLALCFTLVPMMGRMKVAGAQMSFWVFSAVIGASLSTILLVYTGQSIAQTFFITAAAFGALSTWGYVTKKDISGWGSFLIMGVFGIIIAAVVNIFMQSSALNFAISAIGLLIFAGLTAYHTQQIKDGFFSVAGDGTAMAKSAIFGALSLYLDFINMFQSLLSLIGDRD